MKVRLRAHGVVANPRHSESYVCGLRQGLSAKPETQALPGLALNTHSAAHQLGELARERQTEPGAVVAARVGAIDLERCASPR